MLTSPATVSSDSRRPQLEMVGIGKSFPGVRALDEVTFSVQAGEVHGIVGENGAGKSTLMAVASGALVAEDGTVTIAGTRLDPAAGAEQARELGLAIVRQEPALLPELTVAENLYLGVPARHRPSTNKMARWADEQLARWGPDVPVRGSDRVTALVPQQRFIVEICRALAQEPAVLVLDEPTEHLVGEEVDRLFGHIRRLVAQQVSVVYISHRIHEVKAISQRVTVLRNGRTQGTYDAADVSEHDIVTLIVGRELDAVFPARATVLAGSRVSLTLDKFETARLAPLHLDVMQGEIIGLAGIEGNGQRDLLRALAGLQKSSGSVKVGDVFTRTTDRSHGIAYVSGDRHSEGILTGLSVGENIALRNLGGLARGGLLSHGRESRLVDGVVARFTVKTPSTSTPMESLSGGNQQKALLGGVLASKPSVLLVDEPTQGVDVGAKSEIYRLLREAAEAGMAIFVLSSDSLELSGISDRVLVFSRGHVVSEFTGDTITEANITHAALTAETERTQARSQTSKLARWLAGDSAPAALVSLALLALTLFTAVGTPAFVGERNINIILALGATLSIAAIGQLLVMLTGGIDLSVGPVMGFSVVVASFYLVDGTSAADQLIGWVLLLLLPPLVGVLNWVLIDVVGLYPMIATLATYMGLQGISLVLRPVPGGIISEAILTPLNSAVGPIPVSFVAAAVLAVLITFALYRLRWGIALRAAGSSPSRAELNGLSPRKLRFTAYVGCSFLAGLAGLTLLAQIGSGDSTAGVAYTLTSITAAVVGGASAFGGRGSAIGAVLGAVLVQVVASVTTFLQLDTSWQYYLVGAMTVAAVALYSRSRRLALAGS